MLEIVQGGTMILAALTMGWMTGIFQLYSHTVMPGLGRTDDRIFVGAFQAMDRAIMNPLFLITFMGPFVFTGAAMSVSFGSESRPLLPWLIAALLLYLAAMIITLRVNVPRNDAVKAAGDLDAIPDVAAVRAAFDEALWTRWNHVRTIASTAAFACLLWALVLFGRIA